MALVSLSSPTFLLSSPNLSSLSSPRACNGHFARTSFLPPARQSLGSSSFMSDGLELLPERKWNVERPKQPGRLAVQALFGLGVPELVVIAGVAAIIFGPKKLPEIGKSLGRTVKSFQQAAKEFQTEVKGSDAADAEAIKSEPTAATAAPDTEKENTQV